MFNLNQILTSYSINSILAVSNSLGPNFWYFIVVIIMITGITASIVLVVKSNKPDDWYHETFVDDDFYMSGRLGDLASKIHMQPPDYSDNSSIKKNIEMLFFEKIKKNYNISFEELLDMKYNNPEKLRAIINDDYIFHWIINFEEMERQKTGFFDKGPNAKEVFINSLNQILDRMEAWGK